MDEANVGEAVEDAVATKTPTKTPVKVRAEEVGQAEVARHEPQLVPDILKH